MTNDPYSAYRLDGCLPEDAGAPAPALTRTAARSLPRAVDLREGCSPVEDQGRVGSCTANAVAGALEYHQRRARGRHVDVSRLFMYFNARRIKGDVTIDKGCKIREAVASVVAFGACSETLWPYGDDRWAEEPGEECYSAARDIGELQYACVAPGDLKAALAAGLPVVFGMDVARSLFGLAGLTARIDAPVGDWPVAVSGHAMLLVGYDDADGSYLVRNSWGPAWGDHGHLRIAYEAFEHYTQSRHLNHWVIGDLSSLGDFMLGGASQAETQRTLLDGTRHPHPELRATLEENLDRARRGFRERLRGPGAGGGY